MIKIKRAYDPILPQDGKRFLVDRLWPRGISREKLKISQWVKEIAPSEKLRTWFNHDPQKWNEFQKRYQKELKIQNEFLKSIARDSRKGVVTLLFGAKDPIHNNAQVLKKYLESFTLK